MVDLLDSWEPMLPTWISENINDQLILPKIHKEVDAWNPLTDLVPIHAWIHPWLPRLGTTFTFQELIIYLINCRVFIHFIGSKLEIVYPTIRQKMAQALVAWNPSDQSAKFVDELYCILWSLTNPLFDYF